MNFSILLLSLAAASLCYASERAVVQQMKGKRAIIQFEKDIPFSVGQKVYLNSEEGTELGFQGETRNLLERKNLISFSAALLNSDTSPDDTTEISVSGSYGWNKGRYEYGPLGSISIFNTSSDITSYSVGGFFDYNMVPNISGESFIWGGFGQASLGNYKAGSSYTLNLTTFTAGGFIKLFVLSPVLAFRINAYYSYLTRDQVGGSSTSDFKNYSTTGFSAGLSHYF